MIVLLLAFPAIADDVQEGAELFAARCAVCHGEAADGNSPAGKATAPPAADLTAARFAPSRIDEVLVEMVAGTAMPGAQDLEPEQRAALNAWIQTLAPPAPAAADPTLVAEGRAIYAIRCTSCHGDAADGKGPSASLLQREPADFTRKQPTTARVAQVLDEGIAGTGMTPMGGLLSSTETAALTAYLQSVFVPES